MFNWQNEYMELLVVVTQITPSAMSMVPIVRKSMDHRKYKGRNLGSFILFLLPLHQSLLESGMDLEMVGSPFLWVSITSKGELVNYWDLDGGLDFTDDLLMDSEKLGFLENELIQLNVSFMGKFPMVVEENLGSFGFGKVPSSEERIIRMGVAHRLTG
ncbi:unnamed protein product [Fraxinus pennsylvanica]|uniref:Uncharacterized protein n=1 Tax=Fraxinus pennsylvanica TaxID=56036 RepID=A0AAD1ZJ18_9LAMI|nr:unnamed protein product [Fraxinus pennsylvanica]